MASRPKPRSNTERGRAAKLRARLRARGRLSRAERAWLAAYERETSRRSKSRSKAKAARAKKPRHRSARADAIRFVLALAKWSGGAVDDVEARWIRDPKPGRPGSGEARVEVADVLGGDPRDFYRILESRGLPRTPSNPANRAANIRVRVESDEMGDIWLSLAALSKDWDQLIADAMNKLARILEKYQADAIIAWSVYVSGWSA